MSALRFGATILTLRKEAEGRYRNLLGEIVMRLLISGIKFVIVLYPGVESHNLVKNRRTLRTSNGLDPNSEFKYLHMVFLVL